MTVGRRDRRAERWLPLAYFVAAIALSASALPSVLRQLPPEQNQTAELSPDAPPDDEQQAIISSLNRASSGTAGAGTGEGEGIPVDPTPTVTTPPPPRFCPRGVGNPPRQVASVYAPPCAAAFRGDNGGVTHQGVTGTDIRIGLLTALIGNTFTDGEIPSEPGDNESASTRTWRVLRDYFNQNFEFYGRRLRFFYVLGQRDNEENPVEERRAAVRADEEYGVFAAVTETGQLAYDELVRRQIPATTLAQPTREYLAAHQPYAWGTAPDVTSMGEMGAEYVCKKLAGRPPKFTDDSTFNQSQPRKFGILAYQELDSYANSGQIFSRQIKEQCGVDVEIVVEYGTAVQNGTADQQASASTAMSRMKAQGVTTIIALSEFFSMISMLQQADQQLYYPEWFIPGFGGLDYVDIVFQTFPHSQWRHAFGFSYLEIPTTFEDRECTRAYKTLDPANDPDDGICYYFWPQLVQLAGAIQMAGPKLTPETLQQALFRSSPSKPEPRWRVAGKYGPGDYTYPDYAVEIWYDPTAIHPNGRPGGAFHYTNGGRRFARGEWDRDDSKLFAKDGTTVVSMTRE